MLKAFCIVVIELQATRYTRRGRSDEKGKRKLIIYTSLVVYIHCCDHLNLVLNIFISSVPKYKKYKNKTA